MARGILRIFLGAAPGVGKTYSMLEEGHVQAAAGVDVVAGIVLDHGREQTRAQLAGLEQMPTKKISYRDTDFDELDVAALLARRPALALVDEYAHSNVPGAGNAKRWQDVEALLNAGIDVYSTVNVQHLASLGDVVESITGVRQQETVPDEVVRRADQIELVDIPPELLRQRLTAGNVYARDKVDAALANYFRLGNLTALRELALLWLADRVEEGVAKYRKTHGIEASWPTRERIVVGLTGGAEGEFLLRRAARILSRVSGGELLAVHIPRSDGVAGDVPLALESQRQLVTDLGGTYHSVGGEDPARALLDFARSVGATQIVIGSSRHKPLLGVLASPGVGARVVRDAGDMDVHMVPHPLVGKSRPRLSRGELNRKRVIGGFALAVVLPVLVQLCTGELSLELTMLIQFAATIAVALVGGLWPAVVAAVWSSLMLNYFSAPPIDTLNISDPENLLALAIFLVVAVAVALAVDQSARRSREATKAGAEAATLSELARGILASQDTVQVFLEQVREHFGMRTVALFSGVGNDLSTWRPDASVGEEPPSTPDQADNVEEISEHWVLGLSGRILPASDRRLLGAFGAHLIALEQREALTVTQREYQQLAQDNKIRTSVLRAVSHDLRTPLAGIKLAVSSLRQTEVQFDPADEAELLATIEHYSDRMEALVGNLLDMSRLSADMVQPVLGPVTWQEILPAALHGVPAGRARSELPANMPAVEADPGLLERVIANIVENAVKYAPDSEILMLGSVGGSGSATIEGRPASELRIVDHGKGVPAENVMAMFRPFQRLDDVSYGAQGGTGVGLGLAVAKGFTEIMGGVLEAEETPGGGLTMIVRLPLSTGTTNQPA
jgi:two-component system, OmpR family, sensor histidine kinase KdpD